MTSLEEIHAIEAEYFGPSGKPTLGRAFDLLLDRWANGARERETALRLLFLNWYACSEPNWYTGLEVEPSASLARELFAFLGGPESNDEELMFVVFVMAQVAPFCFGGPEFEREWVAIGDTFETRLGERMFRLDPRPFEGRGYYGVYFAGQVRAHFKHNAEADGRRRHDA